VGPSYLEDLGAGRMVHEGKAPSQGKEPAAEGARARHVGDGEQPGPAAAELGAHGGQYAAEAVIIRCLSRQEEDNVGEGHLGKVQRRRRCRLRHGKVLGITGRRRRKKTERRRFCVSARWLLAFLGRGL
jgi:hypothetical protein